MIANVSYHELACRFSVSFQDYKYNSFVEDDGNLSNESVSVTWNETMVNKSRILVAFW